MNLPTLPYFFFHYLIPKFVKENFKPKTSLDQEAVRQPSKKNEALTKCNFNDMKIIQPLGAGGFGLVKLVRVAAVPDKTFALKCIQKVTKLAQKYKSHLSVPCRPIWPAAAYYGRAKYSVRNGLALYSPTLQDFQRCLTLFYAFVYFCV